jgi:mono/diheme cytochrome c family protein
MRWLMLLVGVVGVGGGAVSCGGADDPVARWRGVDTAEVIAQALPAEAGYVVFKRRQCHLCHGPRDNAVAPTHHGLWGREVTLEDGRRLVADEAYIRESITHADRKVVAGFRSGQMANYDRILSRGEVDALVAYIRSIGPAEGE